MMYAMKRMEKTRKKMAREKRKEMTKEDRKERKEILPCMRP